MVERFTIPGPAGSLECLFWPADEGGAPRAAAVVCHPHPLRGGTMDNNVVFRTARGLQKAGLAVLRFNFRGVGASEGAHDGEGGEELDLVAALDHLEGKAPGCELWAAGFSFGARTAAALATRERRIARALCVTMPCKAFDCSFLSRVLPPTHLLMAGADEFGNLADLRDKLDAWPAHLDAAEIPDTDHFFRGKTPQVEEHVRTWASNVLEAAS